MRRQPERRQRRSNCVWTWMTPSRVADARLASSASIAVSGRAGPAVTAHEENCRSSPLALAAINRDTLLSLAEGEANERVSPAPTHRRQIAGHQSINRS
jgi:hypothetical protein